jgi:hypothetical protein
MHASRYLTSTFESHWCVWKPSNGIYTFCLPLADLDGYKLLQRHYT